MSKQYSDEALQELQQIIGEGTIYAIDSDTGVEELTIEQFAEEISQYFK